MLKRLLPYLAVGGLSFSASAAEEHAYGSDLSVGFGVGSMLSDWAQPGLHGVVGGRFDAFLEPYGSSAPRMGVSFFVSTTAGVFQNASETVDGNTNEFTFEALHTGVLSVLRYDTPATSWTGITGFGFGRIDLNDYYDGVHTLPTATFETGVRRSLGENFIDALVRASWATTRSLTGEREEWWCVQTMWSVGLHAR